TAGGGDLAVRRPAPPLHRGDGPPDDRVLLLTLAPGRQQARVRQPERRAVDLQDRQHRDGLAGRQLTRAADGRAAERRARRGQQHPGRLRRSLVPFTPSEQHAVTYRTAGGSPAEGSASVTVLPGVPTIPSPVTAAAGVTGRLPFAASLRSCAARHQYSGAYRATISRPSHLAKFGSRNGRGVFGRSCRYTKYPARASEQDSR